MSDFLETLVLRAAGLPLATTPAPRTLPAPEPEATLEEQVEEVAASEPTSKRVDEPLHVPSRWRRPPSSSTRRR